MFAGTVFDFCRSVSRSAARSPPDILKQLMRYIKRFGYDLQAATHVALTAVRTFLSSEMGSQLRLLRSSFGKGHCHRFARAPAGQDHLRSLHRRRGRLLREHPASILPSSGRMNDLRSWSRLVLFSCNLRFTSMKVSAHRR